MKNILIVTAAGIAIAVGIYFLTLDRDENKAVSTARAVTPLAASISRETLAEHNNIDDCYIAIGSEVFDMTSYIPTHPGGKDILRGCGKVLDGTMQHPGGAFDGDKIKAIARPYKIGTLAL